MQQNTWRSRAAAAVGAVALALAAAQLASGPEARAASSLTVVAHRGDTQAAPENTIPAFRQALAKGAHALEMDVRFTSTKYPVVLHDLTLDRTTDCTGMIGTYTLARLAGCDAGGWFSEAYRGVPVPTLDSALRAVAAASTSELVLLHVKQLPDPTMTERLRSTIARHGLLRRTIVIADVPSIVTRLKAAGFTQIGLVFSTSRGWMQPVTHYLPYNAPLDRLWADTVHRHGAKIWPVENRFNPLGVLLSLGYLDGVLVTQLDQTFAVLALPTPTPTPSSTPSSTRIPSSTPIPSSTHTPSPTGVPSAPVPPPTPMPAVDPAATGELP